MDHCQGQGLGSQDLDFRLKDQGQELISLLGVPKHLTQSGLPLTQQKFIPRLSTKMSAFLCLAVASRNDNCYNVGATIVNSILYHYFQWTIYTDIVFNKSSINKNVVIDFTFSGLHISIFTPLRSFQTHASI